MYTVGTRHEKLVEGMKYLGQQYTKEKKYSKAFDSWANNIREKKLFQGFQSLG